MGTPPDEIAEASPLFAIPDSNFADFKSRVDRLAKRAVKLGLPAVGFHEIGTSFKRFRSNAGGESPSILVHHVEVFGERPYIAGWRFCGKLEHTPGTNDVVVKQLNEGDLPAMYLTCEPNCDHCQKNRARRDTFVIKNSESGEYKQIGRSCISDFFGGKDPEAVAALFELMQENLDVFRDLEDWSEEGGSAQSLYYDPGRVLMYAACAVRTCGGYISARDGEERNLLPTGHLVRTNLTVSSARLRRDERLEVLDQDRDQAESVLEWLRSEAIATKEATYFHNLRVMTAAEAVSYRNIGLYSSAIAAFERDKAERLAIEFGATSQYVGAEGAKIALKVTLVATKLIPGQVPEQFGDKVLHRFVDEEGNLLVWFSSGHGCDMVIGNSYNIRATVKKHGDYRNAKQTTLLRVTCPDMKVFGWITSYDGDLKGFRKKLSKVEDVNVKESGHGRTPFLTAVIWEREDIARELLKAGAAIDARDAHGVTAEIARPEIYERLRSEALAQDWITPAPGVSYGFIRCEETALDLLRSFGVRTGVFDSARQGVFAEVPPSVLAELTKFPADFKPDLHAFDPYDEDAIRTFVTCQEAISPTEEMKALWTAKLQEAALAGAPPTPARKGQTNIEVDAQPEAGVM